MASDDRPTERVDRVGPSRQAPSGDDETVRVGPAGPRDPIGPVDRTADVPGATVRRDASAAQRPIAPSTPLDPNGRFELRGRIGAGNHGVVFRARDLQLERDVAIKRFSHYLADDPRAMRRISREVATLARVSHPNVVTVHDLVHLPDGDGEVTPHLVMELVEGTSVRDLLARHGPSPRSVVAVRGVLDGLAACHRADILHLDIKPANVLVTGSGGVKIVDFGIARAASDATATVAGTPHYMAPEQYDGRADQRSDVYSVGCLLFECLTGRPPFEGSMAEQLMAHRTRERPDPRALVPHLDPTLSTIVRRSMAIDPEDRYPDVDSMHAALARVDTERGGRSDGPPTAPTQAVVPGPGSVPPSRRPDPQASALHPLATRPPDPGVTRWSRAKRVAAGLALVAFVLTVVPSLVWGSVELVPVWTTAPVSMGTFDLWWVVAVAVAALLVLGRRRRTVVDGVLGPDLGQPRPPTVDRDLRRSVRAVASAAFVGSLPMLFPWYAFAVVALSTELGLATPGGSLDDGWTLAWVLMPAASALMTWWALTRFRLRVGRILSSTVLLAGAALAGVLFVAYPALLGL